MSNYSNLKNNMSDSIIITDEKIIQKIYIVRGVKGMIDRDLAELYQVETRTLNQAVKRNEKRFPQDFMFQMTEKELREWKSQIQEIQKDKMGLRRPPYVFTEQGVAMLSSVLNSDIAIEVNIQIIRIFSRIREIISSNNEILLKLEKVESKLLKHQEKVNLHDEDIALIFKYLKQLLNPTNPERESIGFKSKKKD
jgi:hypothetical protein